MILNNKTLSNLREVTQKAVFVAMTGLILLGSVSANAAEFKQDYKAVQKQSYQHTNEIVVTPEIISNDVIPTWKGKPTGIIVLKNEHQEIKINAFIHKNETNASLNKLKTDNNAELISVKSSLFTNKDGDSYYKNQANVVKIESDNGSLKGRLTTVEFYTPSKDGPIETISIEQENFWPTAHNTSKIENNNNMIIAHEME